MENTTVGIWFTIGQCSYVAAAKSALVATFKHTEQDIQIGEHVALPWLVCPIFK